MERFKHITSLSAVVMGRVTWKSLPNKPLPARINIIVTSYDLEDDDVLAVSSGYEMDHDTWGAHSTDDLKTAIRVAHEDNNRDVFLIGGQRIYEEGMNYVDTLFITEVQGDFKCDRFFPEYDHWSMMHTTGWISKEGYTYRFTKRVRVL